MVFSKNNTYLFLDDIRKPIDCTIYMPSRIGYESALIYSEQEWVIVKDYQQFVDWISKNGIPSVISFDHDLADEHYNLGCACGWDEDFPENFTEKTGLDCAKWLINYFMDHEIDKSFFPKYYVHSMNPVGSERIKNYIFDYQKHA